MTAESIRKRNARIIENISAASFDPEYDIRTDEEARAYASRLDEAGYELGYIGREFAAMPADGSLIDPGIMGAAMEAVYEIRQFANLEKIETATRALMEREGSLEKVLAYCRPVVDAANAENCRHLLGDRSTDENARTFCQWLLDHMYDLSITRKGQVRVSLDGVDLYPMALARAIRLSLGDENA